MNSTIDLTSDAHTVAPGRYAATISNARVITNRDNDTKWLFLSLEAHDPQTGEILGEVEDRFITIGAAESSKSHSRLREGLLRLAIYGKAIGADFNGKTPEELPALLVGETLTATVSRKGVGIHAENRIVSIGPRVA